MNDQALPPAPEAPQSPAPPRVSGWRRYVLPVSCAVGCLPWFLLFFLSLLFISGGTAPEDAGEHIALIRVTGVITAGRGGSGLFDGPVTGSDDVVEQLERVRRNENAKVVVIRINSPGGSPSGSEEIYNEIRRVSGSGKRVYASMGDVAASGGYYVASACDDIYADASSITGSIGVIYRGADMSGLFKKIGFDPQVVKSGKFKDTGSPDRPLTPEERKLIQGIIDDTYNTFVQAVAEGRNMPEAEVRKIADGRILTGNQAKKLKLIDEIGGLHETLTDAAAASGIRGVPNVVEYRKHGFLESIFGAESESIGGRLEKAVADRIVDRLTSPTTP